MLPQPQPRCARTQPLAPEDYSAMKFRRFYIAVAALTASVVLAIAAAAASTVVVTPVNQQGWTGVPPGADTRPGGTVGFVLDNTAPGGDGALQLTTTNSGTAKAQYMHATSTPLADVTDLSYHTRQISASFAGGDPSYQVVTCLGGFDVNGACVGFTTLVYEPYQNGSVSPGVWQFWDVDAGQFWSSRSFNSGTCVVTAGGGGAPFYTLSHLNSMCPNAEVIGFGVNIGSNNPAYNVYTDLFTFNGTTYDFEVNSAPSDKEQCKNGGWATFNPSRPAGPFKNQGDCIQFANTGK